MVGLNLIFFVFTLIYFIPESCALEDLTVSLEDGLVRGSYKESYDGRKYIAFEGIPYAEAPIGNLRFEDPQPVKPWPGILEAKNLYSCLQLLILPGLQQQAVGQEDCLYLNVYVPGDRINASTNWDVLFHIHGGAFMLGSPGMIALPTKIMDRDIVYVSINYRLGPFGFYSSGDGRGNYGLKDQTAALQWVRRNIERFGGNKQSVTLCGLSAGGASVHLHYFSRLSKGLFHKGFAQSGVALNPWVVATDPSQNAKKLAETVGCSGRVVDVQKCLKERPALQITEAIESLYQESFLPLVLFGPVLEANSTSSFLVEPPRTQLESKEAEDLPLLISMTMDEGVTPAALAYGKLDELNKDWGKWAPLLFDYFQFDQARKDEVSRKVREYYFKDQPITKDNFKLLVQACTQRFFHLGAEEAARAQAKSSTSGIYFLLMNYAGEFKPMNITGFDVDLGVGHGSDGKFYYDGLFTSQTTLNAEEERMKDKLLDMTVSFARTGKPVIDGVDFRPVSKSGDLNYLLIDGPDDLRMTSADTLGPHDFWKSLGIN